MTLRIIGLLLTTLFGTTVLSAQNRLLSPASLQGETWAVVVGVSDYLEDALDLSVAAEDAMGIARWLHLDGFPPVIAEKMVLLLDHDATLNNITTALGWVADHAGPNDRIIFYFSGHGAPEGLAPADFDIQRGGNLLSHALIKTILNRSNSHQILLLIDACHAQGSEDAIYIGAVSDLLDGYLNSGMSILSSSTIDQSSFEFAESGKSYFTHYFLQGITEGFADKDQDQWITVQEAFEYARLNVQVMTGRDQIPQAGGDYNGTMILRKL